jgi:hypothetical protein
MNGILTNAAAVGNATASAISFRPRNKGKVYFYEERQLYLPFAGGSHEFMDNGELVLNDLAFFRYMATGIAPAMARPEVGSGLTYAFTTHDQAHDYLDVGKTYQVTMPAPIPVKSFLVLHGVFKPASLHVGNRSENSGT